MLSNFQRSAQAQSDDRLRGARRIGALNGTKAFRDSVGLNDKIDHYTFKLTGRSSFNLSLKRLQNNVDVFLLKAGRVIARSAKGGRRPEAISTTLDAGTYYVRVNQRQGNSRYRLALSATPLTSSSPSPSPNPIQPPSPSRRVLSHGSFTTEAIGFVDLTTGVVTPLDVKGPAADFPFIDIAARGNDLFVATATNYLYKVNASTGDSTLIGHLGFSTIAPAITGLAFDPSGVLYATTMDFGSSPNGLYTVDLTTGQANLVATFPEQVKLQDIAYDDATGRFIGVGAVPNKNSDLYSIGLGGDFQLLGSTGFQNIQGLLFENGMLYGFTWGTEPKQLVFSGLRQGVSQATIDKFSTPAPNSGFGVITGAG